ncbi:MAG: hypothetical protein K2X81_28425, partial [Candidatus Obscuribacterales bacterium]|nr:hypothetical protein [Candidatus Obscuribacterales bacterium]
PVMYSAGMKKLKARDFWDKTIEELQVNPSSALEEWKLLEQLYSAPSRHYHSMLHLDMMISSLARLDLSSTFPVRFAIFYHDAVYESQRDDNEEKSALLAEESLARLQIEEDVISKTSALILATKKHQQLPDEMKDESGLFLDLDLLILGTEESTYVSYAEKIRKEYAWVPEKDYQCGRSAVLQSFLERPFVFFTKQIRDSYESNARRNLQNELNRLNSTKS